MICASTRNPKDRISFREAVFRGLAPDGGLYHLTTEPDMAKLFRGFDAGTSFVEMARQMIEVLIGDELSSGGAERIAKRAFFFEPKLRQLGPQLHLLELFHGPSCAFKDFGASFLAAAMEEFLAQDDKKAIILTATSGDTGSAVAQAFHKRKNIDVVILYPSGRVSPLQEKQLTTLGDNITALEVKGSFDDCQRMVKEAFVDPTLIAALRLTSANSINLGRLVPQSFYYVHAFAQVAHSQHGPIHFCVPSGNFGNLTAGLLAWRWGLPVDRFLSATNQNKVVPEYLASGVYAPRPSVQTLSNAMDVGNPSNFERMQAIFGNDLSRMRLMVGGSWVTDEDTRETMARYFKEQGLYLDPHSALGVCASERHIRDEIKGDGLVISLATAHPGKFLEAVEECTGTTPPLPPQLAESLKKPKVAVPMGTSLEELRTWLLDSYKH